MINDFRASSRAGHMKNRGRISRAAHIGKLPSVLQSDVATWRFSSRLSYTLTRGSPLPPFPPAQHRITSLAFLLFAAEPSSLKPYSLFIHSPLIHSHIAALEERKRGKGFAPSPRPSSLNPLNLTLHHHLTNSQTHKLTIFSKDWV